MTISPEETVSSAVEYNPAPGIAYQADAPMLSFVDRDGRQVWITALWDKTRGGIEHMETIGPLDHPLERLQWIKTQDILFRYDHQKFSGSFWLVNVFPTAFGLLGIVHVENAENSGIDPVTKAFRNGGRSRIGLAWSTDDGNSYTYFADIIIPQGDPEPFNVQGAPLLVMNGYFYLYYSDIGGVAVARAPVTEVLATARNLAGSPWMKYNGETVGFGATALGGPSTVLNVDGIPHTDAACNKVSGKCYLVLSRMNWGSQPTWVRLYESPDGIHWEGQQTIAEEPGSKVVRGYQYCTIVDASGRHNGFVGDSFFVYCDKDIDNPSRRLVRWLVQLSK